LKHPAVDVNNVLQVEMIKEAVLSKITQYIMMGDRIENDCKGRTLVFNPKTGFEQWVESRYLHGPDIMNDAKLSRTILKDLGILEERERKVEVIGNLKMLWERDRDSDNLDTRDKKVKVINAEAKRID
jgi:predicted membrane chloride channel (bestrophin family)